jgi:uncharacterized protein
MPLIARSSYAPPLLFANGHVQTILPTLIRKVPGVDYIRERIATADGDFLDLDWLRTGARRLAVLSHGLEGSSTRHYMLGMARAFSRAGWDVLAWNFRGCGGEPNRTVVFYHSGATHDLHAVVEHAAARGDYAEMALIGFSMGGNLTLKYLGEGLFPIDARIKKAVVFSVPCDLASSARKMAGAANSIYMTRFLRMLRAKIRAKMGSWPDQLDDAGYHQIKTFEQFDDRYTALLHGFKDAADYYRRASCRQFLDRVTIPSLLVNACNDPFLSASCYPVEAARRSPWLHLETPRSGGHVGFLDFNDDGLYWSERRAVEFVGG